MPTRLVDVHKVLEIFGCAGMEVAFSVSFGFGPWIDIRTRSQSRSSHDCRQRKMVMNLAEQVDSVH